MKKIVCLFIAFSFFTIGNKVSAEELTIPHDDYRVSDSDVTTFPYSSIVYYSKYWASGGMSRGTGIVVGRDYVLTVAHVNNNWASANVIPALKSNNKDSFGRWTADRDLSISSPDFVPGYAGEDYALTKINPRKEKDGTNTHIGDVVKPLTIMPDNQKKIFFVGSELATLG